jgi:hypothetical protein
MHGGLNVEADNGAAVLTDLITERILENAGGAHGSTLVAAYRAKFVHVSN